VSARMRARACVWSRVSELSARSSHPTRRGVASNSQIPPRAEEDAPFQNTLKCWREQIYGHGTLNEE
jgi:hypothetical protein